MTFLQFVLIMGAGVISGFVNTVGGGGSLISLPILIFVGLPSAVANGTNRIALMVQGLVAVHYFRKSGYFYPKLSITFGIPAVFGAILGAKLAISLPDEVFNKVLAVVMLIVLFFIIWRPEKRFLKSDMDLNLKGVRLIIAMMVFFGIGFYGGLIEAGVGFIMIAALTLLTGLSLVKVNSLKVSINVIYLVVAMLMFIVSGNVNWQIGIILAIGNALGAYLGSVFTVSKGDKWIRLFLVVSVIVMAGKLLGAHKILGL